jgi:DNA polymerase bacteriophage-type
MRLLYFDVETHYSTEYSLTKMDPPSYILDPRFELIMAGAAFDDEPVLIIDGPDVEAWLNTLDRDDIGLVSHNAQFDASILSWRYNWRPRMIIDTLSISRTVIANRLERHRLGDVSAYLGLPDKFTTLDDVKGMTRADIIANGMWSAFSTYCTNDTELCRDIFKLLAPNLPDEEFVLHDLVLRMAVDPVLLGDVNVLAEYHAEVLTRKELIFARAMMLDIIQNKQDLMSNIKFAKALERLGVTPPRKVSPSNPTVSTWAFDKRDEEFQELRNHENPLVVDLVETRLGYKSTIEETRTARLLNIAQLEFPHHAPNVLPIALRVAGARTHRLSGDWKCNFQNMGRGSKIREALVAPPGHQLVAADARQIEARILAWYCGQQDLVESFRQGKDVYAEFASKLFHETITAETHPKERFLGKTAVLGCGYGCGPEKFAMMTKSLSALAGDPVHLEPIQAMDIVDTYRHVNDRIKWKWDWLRNTAIPQLAYGRNETIVDGPVRFNQFEITGPSNLKMYYPRLYKDAENQWKYDDAGTWNKLYGAKTIENIVQHLARVLIMQVALRLDRTAESLGARLVLQCHDELVYCVPDQAVELLKGLLHKEMTTPPAWALGLPLATEVKVGPNYGACK